MATHTNISGNSGTRRFAIGRKDGQKIKDGRPYFFEWLRELPEPTPARLFETRTGDNGEKHYELFAALDGILTDILTEEREVDNKKETRLILWLTDCGEDYKLDVGRIDSRYSQDVLKRLLDPNFQPSLKVRFSPFSFEKDGKFNIGLAVMNGTDTKLSANREQNPALLGIPEAVKHEIAGKEIWDFYPPAKWLLQQAMEKVKPKLYKDPFEGVAASHRFPESDAPPKAAVKADAPMPQVEDLPF